MYFFEQVILLRIFFPLNPNKDNKQKKDLDRNQIYIHSAFERSWGLALFYLFFI